MSGASQEANRASILYGARRLWLHGSSSLFLPDSEAVILAISPLKKVYKSLSVIDLSSRVIVGFEVFDEVIVKHVAAAAAIASPGGETVVGGVGSQARADRVEFDV